MFVLQLVRNFFQVFELVLIIYALLSWFPNASESALAKMVQRIVEPFLSLFRKIPMQFGGLDFTVMFALLALSVVERFVLQFLVQFL